MFFAIFWTAFIPFGMVILSLVADGLRRSFRQLRAHALASSNRRPIRRGLGAKRALALKEFMLGVEGLERFVAREPLRRVHECAIGVLALESEPVDPRPRRRPASIAPPSSTIPIPRRKSLTPATNSSARRRAASEKRWNMCSTARAARPPTS